MDIQEINSEVVSRVKPQLDELGFDGFILMGYVRDSSGAAHRALVVDGKNDPMVQDALRPLVTVGIAWSKAGRASDHE